MVNIKVSQTGLINPPGVTPVLTLDQMWRGLVYKSREPQKFVAAVERRDIVSEHENGLTRIEYFKPGLGPPAGKVTGDCEYWAPHRVSLLCFAVLYSARLTYIIDYILGQRQRGSGHQHHLNGP